eukprot:10441-Heterococcus_DN1.PRE.2
MFLKIKNIRGLAGVTLEITKPGVVRIRRRKASSTNDHLLSTALESQHRYVDSLTLSQDSQMITSKGSRSVRASAAIMYVSLTVASCQIKRAGRNHKDPAGWLSGEIIDVRVQQLQDQYGNHLYLNPALFMPRCPHHLDQLIDHEPVKKGWFTPARLPKDAAENLSMFDKVFFPITVGCSHWVLVVADLKVQPPTVSYFDSLKQQQRGGQYVEEITAYLTEKVASKGVRDQCIEFEGYTETPQSATRQSNSNDCDVLMLHYMQELSMAAATPCSVQRVLHTALVIAQQTATSSGLTQEQINESRLNLLKVINNEPDDRETADTTNDASTSKVVPFALTAAEESCVSVNVKPTSPDDTSIQLFTVMAAAVAAKLAELGDAGTMVIERLLQLTHPEKSRFILVGLTSQAALPFSIQQLTQGKECVKPVMLTDEEAAQIEAVVQDAIGNKLVPAASRIVRQWLVVAGSWVPVAVEFCCDVFEIAYNQKAGAVLNEQQLMTANRK